MLIDSVGYSREKLFIFFFSNSNLDEKWFSSFLFFDWLWAISFNNNLSEEEEEIKKLLVGDLYSYELY